MTVTTMTTTMTIALAMTMTFVDDDGCQENQQEVFLALELWRTNVGHVEWPNKKLMETDKVKWAIVWNMEGITHRDPSLEALIIRLKDVTICNFQDNSSFSQHDPWEQMVIKVVFVLWWVLIGWLVGHWSTWQRPHALYKMSHVVLNCPFFISISRKNSMFAEQ